MKIKKKRNEIYFIRITTKEEIKKPKNRLGDYWRFVERKDKLKKAINSNIAYAKNKKAYLIIGKGNYSELELDKGISKLNKGEQLFKSKELFSKSLSPSTKILFKGRAKNFLKRKI
ncbi:hypothetical protein LCGC14_1926170 [marine sediment metagenome]|uniref:Uncharacterized protein n=1 Tax=marine sediment metagenome TaxID=412755 RepID=A0A0F9IM72_9ZZZZ